MAAEQKSEKLPLISDNHYPDPLILNSSFRGAAAWIPLPLKINVGNVADFDALLTQIADLLQHQGRVSYSGLLQRFDLEKERLEAIKDELIFARKIARDEGGKVLVWNDTDAWSDSTDISHPEADSNVKDYTPNHIVEKILASRSAMEGEKKQVTVLFCDIANSMDLAEALGPEAWHDILNRFFKILTPIIHQYEGTVNQYTGDGAMTLFGAPLAAEDHARRACMAALDIQKKLNPLQKRMHYKHGREFVLRIGINSGEVVVGKIGDDLRMDYTAQGHVVGIASRLEELAPANGILISSHTAHLIEGYFDLEPMGVTQVKGVSKPLKLYSPRSLNTDRTRLDIARSRGFSKFVGRDVEMSLLEHAFQHASKGSGQTVAIVAPPGTGKSRLCWEFKQQCKEQGVPVHSAYGAPHISMRAYQSILPLYRSIYNIDEERLNPVEARKRVSDRLLSLSPKAEAALPELYSFLGIPDPYNPPPKTPPELQRRLYLDFTRWSFRLIGRENPMVIILDDLHWFDEASLGMVKVLLETVSDTRTLVVANYRPEMRALWIQNEPNLQRITLQPLDESSLNDLLSDLLGSHPSTEGLLERILKTSSGYPFYVEEVIRHLVDHELLIKTEDQYELKEELEKLPMPASVHSIMASRIDRLSEDDKNILQTAAVIGRKFEIDLLTELNNWTQKDIETSMQRLQRAEFVYQLDNEAEPTWSFKHAITQEVAYQTLLESKRRQLHARVAEALQQQCGDEPSDKSDHLAYHWESAGKRDMAARAKHKAARWAHKLDLREALHHRKEVIRLTKGLAEDKDLLHIGAAARRELIQWAAITGITPDEAERYFREGCKIAEKTMDFVTMGTLIGAYSLLECQRARFTEAIELADQCVTMLRNIKNPEIQATMDGVIFATAYGSAGRVVETCEATARALTLTEDNPDLGAIAAFNIRLWAGTLHAMTNAARGQPDDALKELEQLVPHALKEQELAAVLSIGFMVWIRLYTGDRTDMMPRCEEGLHFAERTEIGYWIGSAHTYNGIELMIQERWEEALQHFEATNQFNKQHHFMDYYNILACIHMPIAALRTGQQERALQLADKARELAEASNSYFFINDACWTYNQVTREVEGKQSLENLHANLDRWEKCLEESGMELCRHLWWWEKAKTAALEEDSKGQKECLQAALESAQQYGAKGNAERIKTELNQI